MSSRRFYAVAGGAVDRGVESVVANLPAMKNALGPWSALGMDRPAPPGRDPIATAGAIISSARRVENAELVAGWLKAAHNARAIEMESAGVYRDTRGRKPFVAIRGISEVVGAKSGDEWTKYACQSAAAFARALIAAWPLPSSAPEPSQRRMILFLSANVDDTAAITFCETFYEALWDGETVQNAFDDGLDAVIAEGSGTREIARLMVKSGLSAAEVRLF